MLHPIPRGLCRGVVDYAHFLQLIEEYLPSRLSPDQINDLKTLSPEIYNEIISNLDSSIAFYNRFPKCLAGKFAPDLFINTLHLKSLISQLPLFSAILFYLSSSPQDLNIALGEMRDSTYFHYIYLINNPKHLLANLMTLVYRCHILSSRPLLREGRAQISSTLEEMSALRYLLGEDNLHFHSVRHWILDWEGEGFSQQLATLVIDLPE